MEWRSPRSPAASPSSASHPTGWLLLARISFCSSTWPGRRGSVRAFCVAGARLPPSSDGNSPTCPCTPYGRRWWWSYFRPCSATVDAPQVLSDAKVGGRGGVGLADRHRHRQSRQVLVDET